MSAIALDPLIAEAKRRARVRKVLVACSLALVAVIGVSTWLATSNGRSGNPARARVDWFGTRGGLTLTGDSRGLWLSTTGGRTWLQSALPHVTGKYIGITDVQFADARHGWAISEGYTDHTGTRFRLEVDRTVDGGRTWQVTTLPGCAQCGSVSSTFFDPERGYVVAQSGLGLGGTKLFSTRDGGATWQLVSRLPVQGFCEVTWVDPQHGIVLTWGTGPGGYVGDFRVSRTSDGGRTWTPVRYQGEPLGDAGDVLGVWAVDGTLVIPADPYRSGNYKSLVYTSSDGGVRWQVHSVPRRAYVGIRVGTGDVRDGVFSAASPDAWVATDYDTRRLFETADGGTSWHVVKLPRALWGTLQIEFTSAQVGWAIGRAGLVRTTDGGRHWTPAGPPKPKAPKRG